MRSKKNTRWETMDKTNIPLAKLIDYFETYNRSEGKSPKTVTWYGEALHMFLDWLSEIGHPTNLGSVGEMEAREFILWLQNRHCNGHRVSVVTINNRVRALRAFFNWLYRKGYTREHLLEDVRPPRLPEVMVETLSDKEIEPLFQVLDQSTVLGSRNGAILALLLDSGVRLSELTSLKLRDIHFEEQYVKVMGKGSKERIVPIGSTTQKALLHYLIHFRGEPAHPGVEEFFLTLDGYSVSKNAVKSMLQRLGQAAGVPRLHPHLCRHTYATNFLLNGGNVLLLKQNLGHTTLTMVNRYVHLATSKAVLLSRSFSPLDRMNLKSLRHRGNTRIGSNSSKEFKAFQRRTPDSNMDQLNQVERPRQWRSPR